MLTNTTMVYFTDENEYISANGSMLKYAEQAEMVKQSMDLYEKSVIDRIESTAPKPFGTLLNFLISADWETYLNECEFLSELLDSLNLQKRKVRISKGFENYRQDGYPYPYINAAFFINNVYDDISKQSSDLAELFIQCTVENYRCSLYEYTNVSEFLGTQINEKANGSLKELLHLAALLISEPQNFIMNFIGSNDKLYTKNDSGLIAVMHYIIRKLLSDLRELKRFSEEIKKSASEITEADRKNSANAYAQDIMGLERIIPRVDYEGISQISEEYFEAYSKSAANVPMESKLKYKQIQKIKAVCFNRLQSAVCYEINHIYSVGQHLSECQACGKYFASKTTRARYCPDCIKREEYAKQYIYVDEYQKIYDRNNKTYNSRYNRDKANIGEEYHAWQKRARTLLKEAQDGAYTIAEFEKLIALPASNKKAGRPKKK